MRIAIISDMHGNLAAFRAVLDDLARQPVDQVVVGGDIALGGRQPVECVDLLIEKGWPAVQGNSDAVLFDTEFGEDFVRDMVVWALERLSPRHLDYLRDLPRLIRPTERLALCHATPWSVSDVVKPDAPEELAGRMMREAGAPVVAYGHIHSAYQRRLPEGLLLSVGGIGFSLDAEPRPTYTILDFPDGEGEPAVEVRRVAYDVAAEIAAMDAAGTPLRPERREQLVTGGSWPIRA